MDSSSTSTTPRRRSRSRSPSTRSWTSSSGAAGVNPGRSGYDLCMEAGQLVEDTRRLLAALFGGTRPASARVQPRTRPTRSTSRSSACSARATTRSPPRSSTTRCCARCITCRATLGVEVDHVPFDARGFVDPDDIRAPVPAEHATGRGQPRLERDRHGAAGRARSGRSAASAASGLPDRRVADGGQDHDRRRADVRRRAWCSPATSR